MALSRGCPCPCPCPWWSKECSRDVRSTGENGGAEVGIGSAAGPEFGSGIVSASESASVRLDWELRREEKRRMVAAVIAEAEAAIVDWQRRAGTRHSGRGRGRRRWQQQQRQLLLLLRGGFGR